MIPFRPLTPRLRPRCKSPYGYDPTLNTLAVRLTWHGKERGQGTRAAAVEVAPMFYRGVDYGEASTKQITRNRTARENSSGKSTRSYVLHQGMFANIPRGMKKAYPL